MKKSWITPKKASVKTVQTGRTVRKLSDWEILQDVIAKVHEKQPTLKLMQILACCYPNEPDIQTANRLKKRYVIQ